MPTPSGAPEEREVKIPVPSAAEALRRLEEQGAEPVSPELFEDDCLWDDARGTLAAEGHALRVRTQSPSDGSPGRTVLTWKGPARVDGGHRVREEVETSVADGEALAHVLSRLGFRPSFRYQKRRRLFTLDGALVAVDRTPLGDYLEIEGPAGSVDSAAARLGHAPADYVTGSYAALWRERHPHGDMLLADAPRKGLA